MRHALEANGVTIVRTPTGVGVAVTRPFGDAPLKVEVDCDGRRLKEEWLSPHGPPWRDCYQGVDMLRCVVRVRAGDRVLAELSLPDGEYPLPYMVAQGEQRHVTESYVSVPPALTVTDEVGAVFTLGFAPAPRGRSPEGEFAFAVLRDGADTGEVASRIERRGGRTRVLTRRGWKVWSPAGREFL